MINKWRVLFKADLQKRIPQEISFIHNTELITNIQNIEQTLPFGKNKKTYKKAYLSLIFLDIGISLLQEHISRETFPIFKFLTNL